MFVLREHCTVFVRGVGGVSGAQSSRFALLGSLFVSHHTSRSLFRSLAALPSGASRFLLKTMQPRQLVRASREHCAFLYAPAGARDGVTLGALPLRPRQGTEFPARCSIVALRPIGRIARFAPHLQVAVSATGRAPFRCLLVFTQSHAAMPARPRYARTLRDSFMRPRAAWGRGTLGALPRENHGDRRDKAA